MNKLFLAAQKGETTDLQLILTDVSKNRVDINVHRCVLSVASKYFFVMFENKNFKESQQNVIAMEVPNANVFADLIWSFYEQKTNTGNFPEWYQIWEYVQCCDFIGYEYDHSIFGKIVIPKENEDFFTEIMNVTRDDVLTGIAKHSIQNGCSISSFPEKILKKIITKEIDFDLITCEGSEEKKEINLWRVSNIGEVVLVRVIRYANINTDLIFYCSSDGKYIAGIAFDDIYIWDTITGKLITQLSSVINQFHYAPKYVDFMNYSLVFYNYNKGIIIWNFLTNELEYIGMPGRLSFGKIYCCQDNTKIAFQSHTEINIHDIQTRPSNENSSHYRTISSHTTAYHETPTLAQDFSFTPNWEILVTVCNNCVSLLDIQSNKELLCSVFDAQIKKIICLPDNRHIVIFLFDWIRIIDLQQIKNNETCQIFRDIHFSDKSWEISVMPNQKYFFIQSENKIKMFSLESGKFITEFDRNSYKCHLFCPERKEYLEAIRSYLETK